MRIQTLTVGPLETNGYILDHGGVAVLVDPGAEAERFISLLDELDAAPAAILLTHGHADHIGAVMELRRRYPEAPVMIHPHDAPMLTDPMLSLAALMGEELNVGEPDELLEHGQRLAWGGLELEVRHIPGHTPGQVVFFNETLGVVAGDTLFAGGIGRWDFPGGDGDALLRAIREQLLTLPDETAVYPGHGPATTIGLERHSNPFLAEGLGPAGML